MTRDHPLPRGGDPFGGFTASSVHPGDPVEPPPQTPRTPADAWPVRVDAVAEVVAYMQQTPEERAAWLAVASVDDRARLYASLTAHLTFIMRIAIPELHAANVARELDQGLDTFVAAVRALPEAQVPEVEADVATALIPLSKFEQAWNQREREQAARHERDNAQITYTRDCLRQVEEALRAAFGDARVQKVLDAAPVRIAHRHGVLGETGALRKRAERARGVS